MKAKRGTITKYFAGMRLKMLASFLLLSMVFQVIHPTVALALTTGPAQPEFASFEPVNTTQLVDNFTGDFNYNIPLLTVPGPNGGYPINLAYHAGIGMEEEASWVGLGWNLNVGEISRQMRGIPDDFGGDEITKSTSLRPNWTLGVEAGVGGSETELWGKELDLSLGASLRIYYNSYRGMGLSVSPDVTIGNLQGEDIKAPWKGNIDFTFDSQSGSGLKPSIGIGGELFKKNMFFSVEADFNSRSGLQRIGLGMNQFVKHATALYEDNKTDDCNYQERNAYWEAGTNSDLSFSSMSSTPTTTPGLGGFSLGFTFKLGLPLAGFFPNGYAIGFFNNQFVADKDKSYKAYGYLNLQYAFAQDDAMMDYNREKEFPLSPDVPTLPVPVLTHDIYAIKGQGAGGMFRAHRNDFGFLHEPTVRNTFGDVNAGLDKGWSTISVGSVTFVSKKKGQNLGASLSGNYSGKWQDGFSDVYDYRYTSRVEDDNDNAYRDYYFKTFGEMTPEGSGNSRFNGYLLADLDVQMGVDFPGIIQPVLKNKPVSGSGATLSGLKQETREVVDNNIEYFKVGELKKHDGEFLVGRNHIYSSALIYDELSETAMNDVATDINSGETASSSYDWVYGCAGSDAQIGAMRVRQNNGMVYEYGVPAYNLSQKDVIFSKSYQSLDTRMMCDYSSSDASKANSTGSRDQYFSSTTVPAYAHTYLLTAVYSPDYVDITGNGPSEDDMGYYTKFNYVKEDNGYQWRAPFNGAMFDPGSVSDDRDDKASYTYGTKEIYYLHSIETKTHMALFFLKPRLDGRGPSGEVVTSLSNSKDASRELMRLEQIRLYKKSAGAAEAIFLKAVNFKYNYSLCQNVYNTTGVSENSGKLTLTELSFSYLESGKGALSPYKFYYGDLDHDGDVNETPEKLTGNPAYFPGKVDRWGNYKSTSYLPFTILDEDNFSNKPETYVKQQGTLAINDAKAWNLTDIVLPSGGKISVDYEADDYAYVQERKAMQMFKIVGTLDNEVGPSEDYITTPELTQARNGILYDETINHSLLVELSKTTADPTDINKYLADIDDSRPMYFKAYVRLKKAYNGKEEADFAYDYVEGYCEIERSMCKLIKGPGSSDYNYALIRIKDVSVKQKETGGSRTHPFSKASWEYMKLSRPDLLCPEPNGSGTLQGAANIIISIWNEIGTVFKGYYKRCKSKKYGNEIKMTEDISFRPSYVRLNSPYGIKYGGGHRVKTLTTSDQWNEIASEGNTDLNGVYGMEFTYRMKDGTSSGVAAYEPLLGGEEIPHHLPSDRYSAGRKYHHSGNELYVTEPQGESFFPAPIVGYRRVVVKNLKKMSGSTEVNKKTQSGILEYEFYTAKEFPVSISKTSTIGQVHFPGVTLNIPGINLSISTQASGYSMGFVINLNNMHGQLRRMTTYPYGVNVDGPAPAYTARTEYIYKTASPFSDATSNALSNTVQMLKPDGSVVNQEMGASTEFYMDMQQNSGYTMVAGIEKNKDKLSVNGIPLPPGGIKKTVYSGSLSKTMMRYAVTNKIINRHGILQEIRTTKDGNTAIDKNLVYDFYTGQPVLTSTTNEFDQPVYTYTYRGYRYYENMGPAFQNYDYCYLGDVTFSAGVSSALDAGAVNHLHVGDKILLYRTSGHVLAWIQSINTGTNEITCIDKNGSAIPNNTYNNFRVIETIHKNLQSVAVGKLVTLNNPLTAGSSGNSTLFEAFNTYVSGHPYNNTDGYMETSTTVDMCEGPDIFLRYMGIALEGMGSESPLTDRIMFLIEGCEAHIDISSLGLTAANIDDVRLYYHSPGKAIVMVGSTQHLLDITYDLGSCVIPPPCDNAGVLHAEAAHMDDEWDYNYADAGDPYAGVGFTPANNPWRAGKKGTWRVESQYLFQVDRKQSTPTNIAKDGTYANFTPFDWAAAIADPVASNPLWTRTNTITMYSPYGYELENRDALGIYSSALYGYDNSLMTAVGSNTSYFETVFDGFEDYASGSGNYVNGHGHIKFTGMSLPNDLPLSNARHTGKSSLQVSAHRVEFSCSTKVAGTVVPGNFYYIPYKGKKYVVTFWARPSGTDMPTIAVTGSGLSATPVAVTVGKPIEGWYRVEAIFETSTGADAPINLSMYFGSYSSPGSGYIDDFRIQPFNSALATYVYDPATFWLMSQLDDRNYATFYNYDEEGNLVQVKKETERGVKTMQTGRKNIKRQ